MPEKKEIKSGERSALSHAAGGVCYHPECDEPLFKFRDGHYVINYEIAHIRDELPPASKESDVGFRYWPAEDMNQDERNCFDNLILLCSVCHKLIDSIMPREYPIDLLKEWKHNSEGARGEQLAKELGGSEITEEFLEAQLYNALEKLLQDDQVAKIQISLAVGFFYDIDVNTGSYLINYTTHVDRVLENIHKLDGNFRITVVNQSGFDVTLKEVGFKLPDGTALRVVEKDDTRIDSRGTLKVDYQTNKLAGHQLVSDITCLYAKTVCGAEVEDTGIMFETFKRFVSTGEWKPKRIYPY